MNPLGEPDILNLRSINVLSYSCLCRTSLYFYRVQTISWYQKLIWHTGRSWAVLLLGLNRLVVTPSVLSFPDSLARYCLFGFRQRRYPPNSPRKRYLNFLKNLNKLSCSQYDYILILRISKKNFIFFQKPSNNDKFLGLL